MLLDNVVLLASQTSRSKAYLQALVENNLYPEHVIILGEANSTTTGQSRPAKRWKDILLPNLEESLVLTCEKFKLTFTKLLKTNVNSDVVSNHILAHKPKIVIYSGPSVSNQF